MKPTSSKLIVGCGYLGLRVAKLWRNAGYDVFATTRSGQRAAEFRTAGLQPVICDVTDRASLNFPSDESPLIDTALVAVGFDRSSGKKIDEVYVDGFANVIGALPQSVRKIIYISSTGVYGTTDGSWVNEETTCEPTTPGGSACLQAEHLLGKCQPSIQTTTLRLAGIYGPDRMPSLKSLANREPIACEPDGYLNLIHVDDACKVVSEIERLETIPSCLVVSDGHPVKRREFYEYAASILNVPVEFEPLDLDSPRGQRARSSKRCDTTRMQDLQMQLSFPTYRDGLKAILKPLRGPEIRWS